MNDPAEKSREELLAEVAVLQAQAQDCRAIEDKYLRLLQELKDREAFNFALFQYSPAMTTIVDREGRVVKSNAAKRGSGDRIPDIGDVMYKDYAARHAIDMYGEMMRSMESGVSITFPQLTYGERYLAVTIAPFPGGAIITSQDITDRIHAEQDRSKLIGELRKALHEVETLRGLLPICASCKRIRDDEGFWNQLEEYFSKNTSVNFSHTLCPECIEKLYPDLWKVMKAKEAGASVAS